MGDHARWHAVIQASTLSPSTLRQILILFSSEELSSEEYASGWFQEGMVLCLDADLSAGTLRVAVGRLQSDGTEGPCCSEWTTAVPSGLQPSATVGAALFPAVTGYGGVRLRFNFGLDSGRPLRFPPAWMEHAGVRLQQVISRHSLQG